jgi:hypothetical protein
MVGTLEEDGEKMMAKEYIHAHRGSGKGRKKSRSRREHGNTMSGKPWNTDRHKSIYIYTYSCGPYTLIYILHISVAPQPPTAYSFFL